MPPDSLPSPDFPMNILVTGATGFVGSALITRLLETDTISLVRAAQRRDGSSSKQSPRLEHINTGNLSDQTDWRPALAGIDVVAHCAARVHVMNEQAADPLAEFRRANVEGTLALARQARDAGVKRFIFISSIKVNGEQTAPGKPYTADDTPMPVDSYGTSKLEAERELLQLAKEGAMEVVIIRPVLVYGPGVKANFLSMMRWMDKGVPLPLGGIRHNRRSIVSLDNLTDLITTCLTHPAASNQVFLAADGEALSTTELLERTARALNKPARLLPVPASWLSLAAQLLGKGGVSQRLCGSLQVDIGKNRDLLGWTPPFSVDASLKKTAEAYRLR